MVLLVEVSAKKGKGVIAMNITLLFPLYLASPLFLALLDHVPTYPEPLVPC